MLPPNVTDPRSTVALAARLQPAQTLALEALLPRARGDLPKKVRLDFTLELGMK